MMSLDNIAQNGEAAQEGVYLTIQQIKDAGSSLALSAIRYQVDNDPSFKSKTRKERPAGQKYGRMPTEYLVTESNFAKLGLNSSPRPTTQPVNKSSEEYQPIDMTIEQMMTAGSSLARNSLTVAIHKRHTNHPNDCRKVKSPTKGPDRWQVTINANNYEFFGFKQFPKNFKSSNGTAPKPSLPQHMTFTLSDHPVEIDTSSDLYGIGFARKTLLRVNNGVFGDEAVMMSALREMGYAVDKDNKVLTSVLSGNKIAQYLQKVEGMVRTEGRGVKTLAKLLETTEDDAQSFLENKGKSFVRQLPGYTEVTYVQRKDTKAMKKALNQP